MPPHGHAGPVDTVDRAAKAYNQRRYKLVILTLLLPDCACAKGQASNA